MSSYTDRLTALAKSWPAQRRVQEGIAFLDAHSPDWRGKINTQRLDIGNSNECMLGQLFGHFSRGMKRFGLSFADAERFGLLMKSACPITDSMALNRAWRNALRANMPWHRKLFAF